MRISKQARTDAKRLFRSCLVEGALDERRVRDAVARVLADKPRGALALLTHFARLVKLAVQQRTAVVASAVPLAPAQRASIQDNLNRRHGRGLYLSFVEDPRLIGGLRVQVGCDIYDGTVRARLDRLAENF